MGQDMAAHPSRSILRAVLRWLTATSTLAWSWLPMGAASLAQSMQDVSRTYAKGSGSRQGQGEGTSAPEQATHCSHPAPSSATASQNGLGDIPVPLSHRCVPQTCPLSGDRQLLWGDNQASWGQPGLLGSLRLPGINSRPWKKLGMSFARNKIPLLVCLAAGGWQGADI